MAQQTLDNDPKLALQNGIDQLNQFALGERIYVHIQGITSAIQTLEEGGVSTDSFKAQITPELMTGVIRRGLSQLFDSLSKALSEFEGTESIVQQGRIANLTPNIPGQINAHAALASRYDISVSDLFPRNFDRQLERFEVLWDQREHSYSSRGFQSQLVPLLEIAFPRHDISELRMPRLTD